MKIAMPKQGPLAPGKYVGSPYECYMLVEDSGHIWWVSDDTPTERSPYSMTWEKIHRTWGPFFRVDPETLEF